MNFNPKLLLLISLMVFAGKSICQSNLYHQKKVIVYTTAFNTKHRISPTDTIYFSELRQPHQSLACVFIDPLHSFQTITGIGGAFTDAAAETFASMSKKHQAEMLKAYFDKKDGIAYNFTRTTIHSTDFSSSVFTYVADNDKELKTFSIQHDQSFKIPLIKQSIAAAGGKLNLFVSPWSPPAWMKDNNNMLNGGKLLPEFNTSWANYFIKFIQAYEKEGIPIWGLSVQNEPMAKQTWESCLFTGEEERDFIKFHLGPALQKSGYGSKKLIAWDHNRDLIYQRASAILNDPDAAKYVWGIGYHWYETGRAGSMLFDNLKRVNEAFPKTNLLLTEGCIEKFSLANINDWWLGEKYGYSMVNDFNNGAVAWTDWNIVLDETGGPNHVNNFCYAPIIYNRKDSTLNYTNIFYYIGHFSKFIQAGAQRIISSSNRDNLQTTAFKNPDGTVAVVVLNTSDKELIYKLWINGNAAETTSLPHSISTLKF